MSNNYLFLLGRSQVSMKTSDLFQDVWSLFMIVLYFSKYGKLKLGKDDEEPEYPTLTWFTMLFACGIGVGLFYYGVSEPIFHYTDGTNRYLADPYRPDNLVAQDAINLTFFHWGTYTPPLPLLFNYKQINDKLHSIQPKQPSKFQKFW